MRSWWLAFAPALALAALQACDKSGRATDADAGVAAAAAEAGAEAPTTAAVVDAGEAKRIVLQIAASSIVATVSDRLEWPEGDAGAKRLGYLRNGAIVNAYDPPLKNDECKDGWYELVDTKGYVCGKVVTIDLTNPRIKLAPKQPDRDAGMPYRYGVNTSDGTPLYRRVLGAEDRKKFEGRVATPPGEEKDEEPSLTGEDDAPPPKKHGKKDKEKDRNRDPFENADAGRPLLSDLKGHGVLVRRMARGFTVAVDRDFKAAGTRWWRTTFGFAAPFDRIAIQNGATKYSGNWFTGEGGIAELLEIPTEVDAGTAHAGTVGFVTASSGITAAKFGEDGKPSGGVVLPRRSAVLLTGREQTFGGVPYQQTSAGTWVLAAGLKLAHPQFPPDLEPNEKWIDVDLTRQQLVAYEGRKPVFATLISSGRKNLEDPEHNFATPPGVYRIREKHVTTTMDGDVASDGPYSIEEVPWVMYFQGSYALHGAFWHDAFGNMRSHGCVNMAPEDARTLFGWANPQLPDSWHGVFAQDTAVGSRVVVHEDTPPKHR